MNKISLEKLLKITSEVTGIDANDITGNTRCEPFIEARCMFCALARRERYRLVDIGDVADLTHGTVCHHLRQHENRLICDRYYAKCYNDALFELDKLNDNVVINIEEREIETKYGLRRVTIITKFLKNEMI